MSGDVSHCTFQCSSSRSLYVAQKHWHHTSKYWGTRQSSSPSTSSSVSFDSHCILVLTKLNFTATGSGLDLCSTLWLTTTSSSNLSLNTLAASNLNWAWGWPWMAQTSETASTQAGTNNRRQNNFKFIILSPRLQAPFHMSINHYYKYYYYY